VKAILKEQPIKVFNYGDMSRDFTYIDDIIDGIIKVINKPPLERTALDNNQFEKPSYKIYNIGNSKPVSLMYFIECIEKALGKNAVKELLPIQPGDVYKTWADVSDLAQDTDYSPKTEIEAGVNEFVEWYLQYYKV